MKPTLIFSTPRFEPGPVSNMHALQSNPPWTHLAVYGTTRGPLPNTDFPVVGGARRKGGRLEGISWRLDLHFHDVYIQIPFVTVI